ncbi:hypothetical protein [Candidatus Berkiella aquae]|uniref:Uncharacterized protein n=1 Tax=Candidatus Berkiella aquae TaxID=295108 RepID=A0A0Q9YYK5_9GAMM|nr:hypothetical protein [Candidatus Berkiella aquae]MCS5711066.1 hypothetical protein [Candidatus Berkiella aquae]
MPLNDDVSPKAKNTKSELRFGPIGLKKATKSGYSCAKNGGDRPTIEILQMRGYTKEESKMYLRSYDSVIIEPTEKALRKAKESGRKSASKGGRRPTIEILQQRNQYNLQQAQMYLLTFDITTEQRNKKSEDKYTILPKIVPVHQLKFENVNTQSAEVTIEANILKASCELENVSKQSDEYVIKDDLFAISFEPIAVNESQEESYSESLERAYLENIGKQLNGQLYSELMLAEDNCVLTSSTDEPLFSIENEAYVAAFVPRFSYCQNHTESFEQRCSHPENNLEDRRYLAFLSMLQ